MSCKVALYVNSRPRLASYLPLARAISRAGHDCTLFTLHGISPEKEEISGFSEVPLTSVTPTEMRNLKGFDLFMTSEAAYSHLPKDKDMKLVAILHSLPDRKVLTTSYFNWLRQHPYILKFDYFAVAVKQPDTSWNVARFLDIVQSHPESSRGPNFGVVPVGYPKLDYLDEMLQTDMPADSLLFCPTKSDNGASIVLRDGARVLRELHTAFPTYKIVFRPYPTDESTVFEQIMADCNDLDRLVIDHSVTGLHNQRRCALLLTDKSSVAISFSLGSGKPSIFFQSEAVKGQTAGLSRDIIGYQVLGWDALVPAVHRCLDEQDLWKSELRKVRADRLYHPFDCCENLANNIEAFVSGESKPDWLSIPRSRPKS